MVTNKKGMIGGPLSIFVNAGAITSGCIIMIDEKIKIKPTIS